MDELLTRLDRTLQRMAPDLIARMNPPCDPALLDEIEERIGLKLPRDIQSLYRWHDGTSWSANNDLELFGEFRWFSAREALDNWDSLAGQQMSDELYAMPEDDPEWNKLIVRPWLDTPAAGWLPLGHASGPNHMLWADLEPGPAGKAGQLVGHAIADTWRSYWCDGLTSYLADLLAKIESGEVSVDERDVGVPPQRTWMAGGTPYVPASYFAF
jgi:cell wall assembly regulator SMI1